MKTRPVVIAHRGASGYLPEHTLVAKALAFGMGADYLEQDVVATRDGHLVVLHDLTLEATTDVQARFAGRARADGHFYCADFSLSEIRTLSAGERRVSGGTAPRYPGRFPDGAGRFGIATLEEEIRFIDGMNRSTGRRVGIYPEIKHPAWHRDAGIDLGGKLLEVLAQFGYRDRNDAVFVQCFDPAELERLRRVHGCRLRLVQLLDSAVGLPSSADMAGIAAYADAIGPSMSLIYGGMKESKPVLTSLVDDAHRVGLAVHPYTFRRDDLPAGIGDFQRLLDLFLVQAGVDGLFTDFPDLAADFIAAHFPA